jgi:hypothetical protein
MGPGRPQSVPVIPLVPAERDFRLLAHDSRGAILVLYQSGGGSQETGSRSDRRSCLWFV